MYNFGQHSGRRILLIIEIVQNLLFQLLAMYESKQRIPLNRLGTIRKDPKPRETM